MKFNSGENEKMKRKLWQEINDQQAEKLCGGNELLSTVAQTTTARQPEAEGKIRGTLILTLV